MSNSSNEGSDNSAVFLIFGGIFAFAILLCWISACRRMERRTNAPNGSQTSQVAPAAVNGGPPKKDDDPTIDLAEPAVAVIEIAADLEGGGGATVGCCCGGGGCGDGGGCGGD